MKCIYLVVVLVIGCVSSDGLPPPGDDASMSRRPADAGDDLTDVLASDAGVDVRGSDAMTDTRSDTSTDVMADTMRDTMPDVEPPKCKTCEVLSEGRCVPVVNRCARDTSIMCRRDDVNTTCGGVCAGPGPVAGKFCPTLGTTASACSYCSTDPTMPCSVFGPSCPNGGKCMATDCVGGPAVCCGG